MDLNFSSLANSRFDVFANVSLHVVRKCILSKRFACYEMFFLLCFFKQFSFIPISLFVKILIILICSMCHPSSQLSGRIVSHNFFPRIISKIIFSSEHGHCLCAFDFFLFHAAHVSNSAKFGLHMLFASKAI